MFQRYNLRTTTPGQSSTSMVPQVRSSPYTSIDEHVVGLDEDIKQGKEHEFLEVFSTDGTSRQPTQTKSRRLAIYLREDFTFPSQDLNVRSLIVGSGTNSMVVKDLVGAFKEYRFLSVLRLYNIKVANDEKALPEEIGQLIFLRYLEICKSSIYEIPQSINNLSRLQTFDYGVARLFVEIRVPDDMFNKMEQLVYLRFPHDNPIRVLTTGASGYSSKIELRGLKSLQTLWEIPFKSFRGLEHLSRLKELRIRVASMEELDAVWQCPRIKMDCLSVLELVWEDSVEVQSLEPISLCCHLTQLSLRGRLCMLRSLPCNLSILWLGRSRLRQDSIPALGNLRHLRFLYMCAHAYEDAKMIISGNAFPQLLLLYIADRVKEILLESPAMPKIRHLVVDSQVGITCEPNSSFPEMGITRLPLQDIDCRTEELEKLIRQYTQLELSKKPQPSLRGRKRPFAVWFRERDGM
ncbi:hypothetical protein Ancab_001177 [Ancistrocladus abbreviatus]